MIRRICVFCGSRSGERPAYEAAAVAMGRAIADRNLGLVYGGGNIGLMGAVANAALDAGAEVIGVIPRFMEPLEVTHTGLPDLRVVGTMHERKALMAELADAFISMPGGIGTFEECLEQMAWLKLNIHQKASGLLNIAGYYDRFLDFLRISTEEGFFNPSDLQALVVADEPELLLNRLLNPDSNP